MPKTYSDPTAEQAIANVRRRERGLLNRQIGNAFESLIESSLDWYRESGLADVEKTPEPIKQLSAPNKRGQFLACYMKAAQNDFKGTIKGGRSVAFEAKHTEDDRISYGRVTPEQEKRLNSHYALGAATFVMVSFGLQDFYRIPWEVWRDMRAIYGRKYIRQDELDEYRVQYIAGVLKLLDGIELKYAPPEKN